MAKRFVYSLSEIDEAVESVGGESNISSLLGTKGASLALVARLDMPVPKGLTITTEACKDFHKRKPPSFPPGMWEETLAALHKLEEETGKKFGDTENPLLVSCRSGSESSMSDSIASVLNLGMNDETAIAAIGITSNPKFVWDSYRRLIESYGVLVFGISESIFGEQLQQMMSDKDRSDESQVQSEEWQQLVTMYKKIVESETGAPFPQDPFEQIRGATAAILRCGWSSLKDDAMVAVIITTMVFGNMGDNSASGYVYTRDPETGEANMSGKYLTNAQGTDLFRSKRTAESLDKLETEKPEAFKTLNDIAKSLEKHFKDLLHIEFTIQDGNMWILNADSGKRTATAAVKIAVDLVTEGLLTKEEAVMRLRPDYVETLLHPYVTKDDLKASVDKKFACGLAASPGAAVGQVYFTPDVCVEKAKSGQSVILVRQEANREEFLKLSMCKGVITVHGGGASHAAVIAKHMGCPAVVGCTGIEINVEEKTMKSGEVEIKEGDWVTIDGTSGQVFRDKLTLHNVSSDAQGNLMKIIGWADEVRSADGRRKSVNSGPTRGMMVWANADVPADVKKAKEFGCEGIGLVRTEQMFVLGDRLGLTRQVLLDEERESSLNKLGDLQASDFAALFQEAGAIPVVVRLLDASVEDILPNLCDLIRDITTLKTKKELNMAIDEKELAEKTELLEKCRGLTETNPTVGMRGARLCMKIPGLLKMQLKAIIEGACIALERGANPKPHVLVPLACHENELARIRPQLDETCEEVFRQRAKKLDVKFGALIETPRSALICDRLSKNTDFISFGTNDLTQLGFGYSRDDTESSFIDTYQEQGVLPISPFSSIDSEGIGKLVSIAVESGRGQKSGHPLGICGEHGGDPASIDFCHKVGLDYVSCSPYRIPVAKLSAAQSVLNEK